MHLRLPCLVFAVAALALAGSGLAAMPDLAVALPDSIDAGPCQFGIHVNDTTVCVPLCDTVVGLYDYVFGQDVHC